MTTPTTLTEGVSVMVRGIEQLRRAGESLRRAEAGIGNRMAMSVAVGEVWSAVKDGLDEWPWELQAGSVPVQFHLVRYGSPAATVRRLPEAELTELRRELLEFVETAERLDGSFAG